MNQSTESNKLTASKIRIKTNINQLCETYNLSLVSIANKSLDEYSLLELENVYKCLKWYINLGNTYIVITIEDVDDLIDLRKKYVRYNCTFSESRLITDKDFLKVVFQHPSYISLLTSDNMLTVMNGFLTEIEEENPYLLEDFFQNIESFYEVYNYFTVSYTLHNYLSYRRAGFQPDNLLTEYLVYIDVSNTDEVKFLLEKNISPQHLRSIFNLPNYIRTTIYQKVDSNQKMNLEAYLDCAKDISHQLLRFLMNNLEIFGQLYATDCIDPDNIIPIWYTKDTANEYIEKFYAKLCQFDSTYNRGLQFNIAFLLDEDGKPNTQMCHLLSYLNLINRCEGIDYLDLINLECTEGFNPSMSDYCHEFNVTYILTCSELAREQGFDYVSIFNRLLTQHINFEEHYEVEFEDYIQLVNAQMLLGNDITLYVDLGLSYEEILDMCINTSVLPETHRFNSILYKYYMYYLENKEQLEFEDTI